MEKIFDRKPGDKVWVMHCNKAVCGTIESIFYCQGISCTDYQSICENEVYSVNVGSKIPVDFKLKDMFSTKEDLIEFLRNLKVY